MAVTQDGGFAADPTDDWLGWADLRRFRKAPLRRPLMVVVPWAVIMALSVAALFVLPRKYRSSTLIFVESEKMPDSFVPRVATEDRSTRLEAITPEILSRTRLERVIEETRPYPGQASRARAVEQMRLATSVEPSGSDGFTIAFDHSDPRKAQQVAARIATLFIEETAKSREQQVTGAVDFLVAQVNEARRELETKDEALRRYKQANSGRLPEQLQTHLATMGILQRELQAVEESLLFARERLESLAGGTRGAAAAVEAGTSADGGSLPELRRQLGALRGRYTDEHPDVERLKARIERLEASLAAASSPRAGDAGDAPAAASRERLQAAELEVRRLEGKRDGLERRIATLRANVEDTPRVEQELATLTRDYQKLNENYVALLSKQLEAQMAGRLEQRWKGARFRVLDPANLPETPYFPPRLLVLGLGLVLGLVAGVAAAVAAEHLDPTVRDAQDLETLGAAPVLACIPHVPALGRPLPP